MTPSLRLVGPIAAGCLALGTGCPEKTCDYLGERMSRGEVWRCYCHNTCYCAKNGRTTTTALGCYCPYVDTDLPNGRYLSRPRFTGDCPSTLAAVQALCSVGELAFFDACGCGCFDPEGECNDLLECDPHDEYCQYFHQRCSGPLYPYVELL